MKKEAYLERKMVQGNLFCVPKFT
uniref:Uncharacterized protein n=1 Tax=Arundo donax TaxID=35708 RepID=A0A0A9FXB2_ARUDO